MSNWKRWRRQPQDDPDVGNTGEPNIPCRKGFGTFQTMRQRQAEQRWNGTWPRQDRGNSKRNTAWIRFARRGVSRALDVSSIPIVYGDRTALKRYESTTMYSSIAPTCSSFRRYQRDRRSVRAASIPDCGWNWRQKSCVLLDGDLQDPPEQIEQFVSNGARSFSRRRLVIHARLRQPGLRLFSASASRDLLLDRRGMECRVSSKCAAYSFVGSSRWRGRPGCDSARVTCSRTWAPRKDPQSFGNAPLGIRNFF